MAEPYPRLVAQTHIIAPPTPTATTSLLRTLLQERVSNSKQLFGVFTLLITVTISLILTGLTVVVAILGLIVFAPVIIVLSPIWVPACAALFLVTAGFLCTCGFGLVVFAVLTWMYRYFRGLHPPGSDRVSYARYPVYEPASHGGAGGYLLHSKVVESAAPGA
ncbi:oleosin-like [Lotus japonicus]|uniref:oleosin-like n=1 Tax=Lotus japonicus TaxID=34305 RepID=UPI00258EB336|nr:oleosin-like [Lotus japonicus]